MGKAHVFMTYFARVENELYLIKMGIELVVNEFYFLSCIDFFVILNDSFIEL